MKKTSRCETLFHDSKERTNMKPTLIIMAAGIGSRFGTGIKQLAKMGKNGEVIMDYSIYDAKEAGFEKVVFIIRKDIEEEFKEVIGDRISKQIEVEYVYQSVDDLPEGFEANGRTKPWGTGQAILCCKDVVKDPYVIINADDYYGKKAFKLLHDFLVETPNTADTYTMGMAGFILKNTLSENGTVTRGLCKTDADGMLADVYETHEIKKEADGTMTCKEPEMQEWISEDLNVSMNMWAGFPDFIEYLEEGFTEFLNNLESETAEYLLPTIVGQLLEEKKATVKVLETTDRWIGITYKDDVALAQESFEKMIQDGIYPEKLWD